jgi:uncharacterized membrane protein YgcG
MTIYIMITGLVLLIVVWPIWYDRQLRRNRRPNNEGSGGGVSGGVPYSGHKSLGCDPGGGFEAGGGLDGGGGGD